MIPGISAFLRTMTQLERAWKRAPRIERLIFLDAIMQIYTVSPGITLGAALLQKSGRRPGQPSVDAPSDLVQLVRSFGYGLNRIAELTGIDERTLRRWWHGKVRPHPRLLASLRALVPSLGARTG